MPSRRPAKLHTLCESQEGACIDKRGVSKAHQWKVEMNAVVLAAHWLRVWFSIVVDLHVSL